MRTPNETFESAWPRSLGSMVLLSQVDVSKLVKGRKLKRTLYRSDADRQVFCRISSGNLRQLRSAGDPIDVEKAEVFIADLFNFEGRYFGEPNGTAERCLRQALYTLVYLAKNTALIRLFIDAYVPLITASPWSQITKYRIAHTFMGDVFHLVYEIEHTEPAGDHEPFDWLGNLNELSTHHRSSLLKGSGCPTLRHPGFPPQHVWISHTNLQPFCSEASYRRALRSFYGELGYSV